MVLGKRWHWEKGDEIQNNTREGWRTNAIPCPKISGLSCLLRVREAMCPVPSRSGLISVKIGSLDRRAGLGGSQCLPLKLPHADEPVLSKKKMTDGQHRRGCPQHPLRDPPTPCLNSCLCRFCGAEVLRHQKGFKMPGSLMIRVLIKNATLLSIPVLKSSRA